MSQGGGSGARGAGNGIRREKWRGFRHLQVQKMATFCKIWLLFFAKGLLETGRFSDWGFGG